MRKVLLYIVWVAIGLWFGYHVWQLPLPWWGKFAIELLLTTVLFTLYDLYRWWTNRYGGSSGGSSAA